MAQRMFILTGDITHAGKVTVYAETLDEAIEKAERLESGDFLIFEESVHDLLFEWDGNDEVLSEVL